MTSDSIELCLTGTEWQRLEWIHLAELVSSGRAVNLEVTQQADIL
jgi:hypothetical protein